MRLTLDQIPKSLFEYGNNRKILEELYAEARRQDRASDQDADHQRSVEDAPAAAPQGKEPDPRYTIEVIHYRRKLADHGNLTAKYAIDGLVDCGILPGDRPELVKEVHRQVKTDGPEMTVIIITEATV